MRGTLPSLLIALLLTVPMIASAQVYKWTDANGTTHFSESPPPQGVKYQSIHTRTDADQPRTAPTESSSDNASSSQSSATDTRSAQLKRFCSQLQSNITLLKSNQNLQRMGSDGKTIPVDNKVRAQQLKQQQMRYDAYCNGK